jgi:hypothetical protein
MNDKRYILLVLLIVVFTNPAYANVNITIQSDSQKTISVIDLSNYFVVATMNTSEGKDLAYANYDILLEGTTDKLTNATLMTNIRHFSDARYDIIWIVAFLSIALLGYLYLNSLKRR